MALIAEIIVKAWLTREIHENSLIIDSDFSHLHWTSPESVIDFGEKG